MGEPDSGVLKDFEVCREMGSPFAADEDSLAHGLEGASLVLEGLSISLLESDLVDFFRSVSFMLDKPRLAASSSYQEPSLPRSVYGIKRDEFKEGPWMGHQHGRMRCSYRII